MTAALLLALSLPCLLWTQAPETASGLKESGVTQVCLPAESAPEIVESWRAAGFTVTLLTEAERTARETLPVPGIVSNAGAASPTRTPFVAANGWRFRRTTAARTAKRGKPAAGGTNRETDADRDSDTYAYQAPARRGPLAVAEAFAYGADAVVTIDPADAADVGRLLALLRDVPPRDLPDVADLAVVDDGAPVTGEVMNLLARRNLLFQIVSPGAASRKWPVVVRLGTKAYPLEQAADPSAVALKVRRQLTDAKRSLRLYGSEVVVARLTGAKGRVRLHLLNYGVRDIAGLRVRIRGRYREEAAWVAGDGRVTPTDVTQTRDATEFTLTRLGVYAVIDLVR